MECPQIHFQDFSLWKCQTFTCHAGQYCHLRNHLKSKSLFIGQVCSIFIQVYQHFTVSFILSFSTKKRKSHFRLYCWQLKFFQNLSSNWLALKFKWHLRLANLPQVQGSDSMTVYIQKWLHRPVFNCTCPSPSYWSFKFNEI